MNLDRRVSMRTRGHLLLLAVGLFIACPPPPAREVSEPFPDPLPQTGVSVPIAEFAALPDSEGGAAKMMLLLDEPGTRRLFVGELHGTLFAISYDGVRVAPYLDLRSPRWGVPPMSGRNRFRFGFLSFAFHPEFATPGAPGYGKFYTASDVRTEAGGGSDVVLLEWSARDAAADAYDGGSPREVLRLAGPFRMNLAFDLHARPGSADHGLLYLGVSSVRGDPQDLRDLSGKILRLDPLGANGPGERYGIPADNPFVGRPESARPEIYAYGLRHPQQFAWDPDNGNMFVVDSGRNVVEEISLVTPGANLGYRSWEGSFRTLSHDGDGPDVTLDDPRSDAAVTYPVIEWDHLDALFSGQVAATGLVAYRGDAIPQLEGSLLFGDIVSGEVFHAPLDELPAGGQSAIRRVLFAKEGKTRTLLELIQEKNREQGVSPASRADLRFGAGSDGRVFLLDKRDGVIRVLGSRAGSRLRDPPRHDE